MKKNHNAPALRWQRGRDAGRRIDHERREQRDYNAWACRDGPRRRLGPDTRRRLREKVHGRAHWSWSPIVNVAASV